MKRFLALALAILLALGCTSALAATRVVKPGDDFYYLDTADVLSEATEGEIYFSNVRLYEACGAQIVFERTEAMWTVAVKRTQADASVSTVDAEAAQAVIEALLEFDVRGIVAVALLEGLPLDAFNDLIDDMSDGLSDGKTRISGDASLSVALIERGRRTI